MDWKDMWEEDGEREAENFAQTPEDTLLYYVEQGYCGGYYTLWDAVAGKQNPQKSVPVLLKALEKLENERTVYYDDLNAIHCAKAICRLLGVVGEEQNALVYGDRRANIPLFQAMYQQSFPSSLP